ncbi:MAG: acyl-[acyl-carrier-protein]--UDP-N-acetylglucosamine O-acyltransferase [Deltaproteobacteria bacterium RBG_13_65_10]|jgi:UDP-N-acetylglucosamine acyltransferase|nr:MAG: acyl-[acyl-carrier-protein]--UDP-N-acetylglucosamine O-acyltransferase [Deltaproteobacteria bacterium RBG_13_65_10]
MPLHPTALISPDAQVGTGNQIGPGVVIEDDVVIGNGNRFEPFVVIKRGSRIGDHNVFHDHAVIGGSPQITNFQDVKSHVRIGNGGVFREYVTVHRASRENESTEIGDGVLIMVCGHVAHDCRLGDAVIIANNAAIAGEVEIESKAFISYGVGVHQFTRVGSLAMIGAITKITQNVLPYFITDGTPARVRGINRVGLERAGHTAEEILSLKEAYRILLGSRLSLKQAIVELRTIKTFCTDHLADFLSSGCKRGFHRKVENLPESELAD